jgi:hypothetical protein
MEVWDEQELAAARDALLTVGDQAGAAEAEILRAEVLWDLGRGDDVLASLERAAELAKELPTSRAKARVYAGLFRLHWLANREEPASRFGQEALAMTDEFDLPEIRAQVLSADGSWRAMRGDPDGFAAIEESIALFEQLKHADAQRPYNNLVDNYYNQGDIEAAVDAARRMRDAWKRFAGVDWLRWTESQEIRLEYLDGEWDRVVEIADRWIADALKRDGHYLEPLWRWHRGRVRLARGDRPGALDDGATALEIGRIGRDPQLVVPSLAYYSRALWELGEAGAQALALELVERCSGLADTALNIAHDWFPEVATVLAALGRQAELEALVGFTPTPTRWRDAGIALGRGDSLAAAEIFRSMGARPYEAEARLLAAREGLDADLELAVGFFREVGASAYLAEAESLLAKSRSA